MDNAGDTRGRLRIGAVSYLNTLPLVHGMQRGLGAERVELSFGVPSALTERMAAGDLDVALLPIVELARIPDLVLIPGPVIATFGPCRSVLLLARRPLSQLRSVALDPESRTSNVLARVLCADVWSVRPEFRIGGRSLESALGDCDAAVRIGDKALFEPVPAGVHVHDLGEVWSASTGLPFVFAAWIARRGVVDDGLREILRESYRSGARALDAIASGYVWKGRREPELARRYLMENIRFDLGNAEKRAVRAFLDAARSLDLIGAVPPLAIEPPADRTLSEAGP